MPEDEAEDKISASRIVWPRGLNITAVMIHWKQYAFSGTALYKFD